MQHTEHGKHQPHTRGKENRERLALNPIQPLCKNSPRKESLSHQGTKQWRERKEALGEEKAKTLPTLTTKKKDAALLVLGKQNCQATTQEDSVRELQ
jgi:hypothetical protein